MRLLILGGTWFLGRVLVEKALHRGHAVCTFNRGKSAPDLPGVEALRGDRTSSEDLAALADRGPWDAVLDTSGMTDGIVQASTQALAEVAGRYAFVSTVNVYQGWPTDPLTDTSPVRPYHPEGPEDESGPDRYGRLKSGCEQAVTRVFGDAGLLFRPGVIIGPYEYVGRLPWWLRRVVRGGRVLAPGSPTWPIQPIDVRDVATFILDAVENGLGGSYNLAAPIGHSTFGEFLEACREVTGGGAEFVWVVDAFLVEQGVGMWTELPLWRPYAGTWHVDAARARAAGLRCRPLPETVTDTWEWLSRGEREVDNFRAAELGIDPERERRVLTAWASRAEAVG